MIELVFVHGIANGPAERAGLKDHLEAYLARFGLKDRFNVTVAEWRSLGDFMADLFDLKVHPVRWDEAVEDVAVQIDHVLSTRQFQRSDGSLVPGDVNILFVAHSMGQPILVSAIDRIIGRHGDRWRKASLLTLGGPMSNGFARPYFTNMPAHLWSLKPDALYAWDDIYNKEDPVCGGPAYDAFLAARPVRIDVPGHPTPFAPLKEHSSYFEDPKVYALADEMAKALEV